MIIGWLLAKRSTARQNKANAQQFGQGLKAMQSKEKQGQAKQGKAKHGQATQSMAKKSKTNQGKEDQGKASSRYETEARHNKE